MTLKKAGGQSLYLFTGFFVFFVGAIVSTMVSIICFSVVFTVFPLVALVFFVIFPPVFCVFFFVGHIVFFAAF